MSFSIIFLLPLYRSGRLAGRVVDHPVDAADFIDDAVGDPPEEFHVEVKEISRHAVRRRNGAEGTDEIVSTGVAQDADGLDGQQ